jgi:hypothetical protein|eukprot:TRINITY_DN5384_c0_g1_i1.p1 TRINITY_DN5384_c0_g1~~TRINITY_DN5384_c0_g1_i1.p1  ORF type:complete len:224 (-),score=25.46 TRINITY_DN5384_c0_g1_i1:287-958(-)
MELFRFLVAAFLPIKVLSLTCPPYEKMADESVAKGKFNLSMLSGIWYMHGVSEATMPEYARGCTFANFSNVADPSNDYSYIMTAARPKIGAPWWVPKFLGNISFPQSGHCRDEDHPGLCHESFQIANHTLPEGMLGQHNFLEYSAELGYFMSYACIGNLFGTDYYAFYLASRSPFVSQAWIDEKLNKKRATGLFNMDGLVTSTSHYWTHNCWGYNDTEQNVII